MIPITSRSVRQMGVYHVAEHTSDGGMYPRTDSVPNFQQLFRLGLPTRSAVPNFSMCHATRSTPFLAQLVISVRLLNSGDNSSFRRRDISKAS